MPIVIANRVAGAAGLTMTRERVTRALYEARRRGRALPGRRRAARHRAGGYLDAPGLVTPLLVNPIEGRSGTTLMMRLLDADEIAFDRAAPFENRYLTYFLHLVSHVDEPTSSDPAWTMDELLEGDPRRFGPLPFRPGSLDTGDWQIRLVRHGLMAMSESFTAYRGREVRYYAEKAWGDTLSRLADAGVRARVVNLIRDPRDVLASVLSTDRKRGYFGFGRTPEMSDDDFRAFLTGTMARNLAGMARAEGVHDCKLVRYEDIVADPAAVAAELGSWLGVALRADRSLLGGAGFARHATSTTAQRSIGRWRRDLTAADATAVWDALGEKMERLGYQAEP